MDKLPENIAVKKRSGTEWKKFHQKLTIFLTATKKTQEADEIKIAILLATGGDIVLDEFNAKYKESDKPKYEDVTKELEKVFAGNESEHYLAHVFRERVQKQGETIAEWVTDLRLKVKVCNYESQQDRMIRDQIIYGVRSKETRRELLKVAKLSSDEAVKICLAMESSSSQLEAFRQPTLPQPDGGDGAAEGEEDLNVIRSGFHRRPPRGRVQNNNTRCQQNTASERIGRKESRIGQSAARTCASCGKRHPTGQCWAIGKRCLRCGRMNHLAVVCTAEQPRVFALGQKEDSDEETDEEVQWVCAVETVKGPRARMPFVTWKVAEANRRPIKFQIDCGATCNVIPESYIPGAIIDSSRRPGLRVYSGSRVRSEGTAELNLENRKTGKREKLSFVVIREQLQPIIGRFSAEAMGLIRFDYEQIDSIQQHTAVESEDQLMEQYASLFDGALGRFPGKVKLHLREGAVPACNTSSKVSPHLRAQLKETIENMKRRGVIRRIDEPTEWVSRLSIQMKKSGDLRLCLDPRHLNEHLVREVYHTTELDEILPDLSGAKVFSKFDLADGFWHCELEESSSRLTTFQTPFGRYCFRRLPFGLNVSTEIFYKRLVQLLEGLQGTFALADDVLICGRGKTREDALRDHDINLHAFLDRCQKKGTKLNRRKVTLRSTNTKFFGFELTDRGIQMDMEKQKAITTMREPRDAVALKSFLGMLSHVARFIPKLSEVVAPLRELCKRDSEWVWDETHKESFKRATDIVGSSVPLAFFDPKQPIEIECDASKNAIGAALIQRNRPVYFASRTMTAAETRYAQIEKELLAVAFALKRFHYFIYPKEVTVFTDHRPLTNIIGKAMEDVPLRLQKLLMSIQRYNVALVFRPGKDMKFADALSRCPFEDKGKRTEEQEVRVIRTLPIRDSTIDKVRSEASKDQEYQQLVKQTQQGWPENKSRIAPQLREFFPYKERFTLENGLVLKDNAVVIPRALRGNIIKSLCCAHMSSQRTVERAKSCVFWPRIKTDIEQHVSKCEGCQTYPNAPRRETMKPHEIPCRPWQKVAMDVAEWESRKFLVMICFYSNLILVSELPRHPTTKSIVRRMTCLFSEHGICDVLITDADPLFRSAEFKEFLREWPLSHKVSSAHYHQSNGKAEAAVGIVKRIIKRSQVAGHDWRKGLLAYNDTPQTKLGGATPGELFFSRKMRAGLPNAGSSLKPTTKHHKKAINARKASIIEMKRTYDRGANDLPALRIGDVVRIRPTELKSGRWKQGEVVQTLPNRSYRVKSEGRQLIRNRRHLVRSNATDSKQMIEAGTQRQARECSGFRVPNWLWESGVEADKCGSSECEEEESEQEAEGDFEDAQETIETATREPEGDETETNQNEEEKEGRRRLRSRSKIRAPDRYGS